MKMNVNMKKSGLLLLVWVLASKSLLYANTDENTKIYTVFVSRGYGGAGEAPESIITNEELLDELQNECKGIDFIVKDTTAALKELERSREGVDGVLIIGTSREYKLAFTGLPTIIVYNLFEWMNVPYKLYNTGKEQDSILVGGPKYQAGKILTAQLDRRNVCSPSSSSAMFKDLVEKVKLIQAIKKLKETRILVVQPYHYLASVDYQGDRHFFFD